MPQTSPIRLGDLLIRESIFAPGRGERCRLEECRAACCQNGIWMSLPHQEKILAHAKEIAQYLPEERRDPALWFEGETEDPDFPGGRAIGSAAVPAPEPEDPERETCVFLRPEDYLCALQVASEALQLPYPGLKPYDCALYPILLSEGELLLDTFSPEELSGADCQRVCEGPPRPILEIFEGELRLAVGEEGYQELLRQALTRLPKEG